MKIPVWGLAVALALLAGLTGSANAVTFTITPSAVSNTYNGPITLQVTGLAASGDTVVVQKFLDADANNVVDASDSLVQQFDLTDGQAGMVVGGVTNFNVPGDTDGAANQQINAKLYFPGSSFVQSIIGKYIFVLSSPAGHFPPQTNFFSVTNFPYPQTITGTVTNNGTPVPGAVVTLFPPPRGGNHGPGNPVAAGVANSSGVYNIQVPPGTYMLVSFKSNYVADFSTSPLLTLGAGQTINTNLALTSATSIISGQLVDMSNPTIGLPGVLLPVMSDSGLIAIGFTDTNGNFTVPVDSGPWGISGDGAGSLNVLGYVAYNGSTNINAGTTGVVLAFAKGTALFYGSVQDNLGNPLAEADIQSSDNNGMFSSDGFSDTNGDYVALAVGGLSGDTWSVQAGNNQVGSLTNYIFSQGEYGLTLGTGQAHPHNFTGILATNHITGHVQFNGTNVSGVQVYATATIGTNSYQAQMDTDTNGNYSLNVANGNWNVNVYDCGCSDGDSLNNILGSGNYQQPGSQNATINNNDATINFTIQACGGVQILTTNLPVGEVNVYYDQFLQGSSCSGSLNWTVSSGSTGGLNLSSGGELSGTPGSSGAFNFTVQAEDGVDTNSQPLSLIISNAVGIATASLPNGTNGVAYTQQLQASGGVPFGGPSPYSWSLASGSLPGNVNLATNGVLSGTPTTTGTFNFSVQVTDSLGASYQQPLSLTINSQSSLLQVTTASLPNGTQNAAYNTTLTATGGQPPYSWSLAPGSASLPYYLALSSGGAITGTPVSSGTSTFIVRVTDATTTTADQVLSLTVDASTNAPMVTLNSVTFNNGQFQFTFNTAPDTSYTLQVSTNLVNWLPVSTFNGSGGPLTVSDLTAGSSPRFYRLKIGP